jgi:hypothetical protein
LRYPKKKSLKKRNRGDTAIFSVSLLAPFTEWAKCGRHGKFAKVKHHAPKYQTNDTMGPNNLIRGVEQIIEDD